METRILETKAGRLFGFDKDIMSVVLITTDGKLIAEFPRPGSTPLEPRAESQTMYMKMSIALGMTTPMNKYHGRLKTAILVKEKVSIICFNLTSRAILVSAAPSFQLNRVDELGRMIDELGIG